jgi:hypothetical protein
MNIITSLVADMRQKKLWPVALLLVVLLVALPILLSRSSSPSPLASLPVPSGTATTPNVPSITAQSNPIHSQLPTHKRNPFTPSVKAKSTTAQAASSTTAKAGAKSSTTASTSGTSSSGTSSSHATSGTTTTATGGTTTTHTTPPTQPTQPISPGKPHPATPAGLTASEVYDVSLSITNGSGGFDTTNSLERLSVLPSPQKPLLVEMGVLKGGHQALFAVQPGASVSGPGTCIPGPLDCELLALRQGQVELLSGSTSGGLVYAEFSVTQIRAHKMGSRAKAAQARRERSAAGLRLLQSSTSTVLSLFDYKTNLGAIVDLRNLGIAGGS